MRLRWAVGAAVLIIAAGCAPPVAAPPTTTPAPLLPVDATSTPAPALTPDATPTPEVSAARVAGRPLAAGTISADQWRSVVPAEADAQFSGQDVLGGTLTVPYPAGWQAAGDANGLLLANFAGAPAAVDFVGQQAAISITLIPRDLAPLAVAEELEPSAPLVLAHFIQSADVTVASATWGQVLLTQAGRRPAAIVSGTNGADDALVVCVEVAGGYAVITTVAEVGQLPAVLPAVALVAGSLEYAP